MENISAPDRAEEYFRKGFNCSQSVFAAFADRYGISEEMALKLSASFGGGLARMREVCGCVSGMALVAGLETGSFTEYDKEGKAKNYELMQHLAEEYKKVSGGSIICRELLDMGNRKAGEIAPGSEESSWMPTERTGEYYKKRPCIQLVREACTIIEREIFGGRNNE
ncbi:MAG: C_GCAxxG_C_C family protein [Lachnospira sp.]|nr:C_GCAxxG_C_C family protein [Lachnospira sp.]